MSTMNIPGWTPEENEHSKRLLRLLDIGLSVAQISDEELNDVEAYLIDLTDRFPLKVAGEALSKMHLPIIRSLRKSKADLISIITNASAHFAANQDRIIAEAQSVGFETPGAEVPLN